jgi:hypothetical protein
MMEKETKVVHVEDRTFYICRHCVKYKTTRKGDMKKHLTKTKYCEFYNVDHPSLVLTSDKAKVHFDMCSIISLKHTYTFMFDPSSLKIEDYSTIVNKYTKIENIIDTDYMTHVDIPYTSVGIAGKSSIVSSYKEPGHPIQHPKDAMEALSTKHTQKESNQQFVCPTCKYTFTCKRNLLNHMETKSRCAHNVESNMIWNAAKSQSQSQSQSQSISNTASTLPHNGKLTPNINIFIL